MTNNEETNELLQKAVEEAIATPEPSKSDRLPYLHEKVGRQPLGKIYFPNIAKKRPENLLKTVDGEIIELHKPRTVINRYTKQPEVVGVPIKVKDEKTGLKFWTENGLVSSAENYKFWEDREAFNKVIKKPKK